MFCCGFHSSWKIEDHYVVVVAVDLDVKGVSIIVQVIAEYMNDIHYHSWEVSFHIHNDTIRTKKRFAHALYRILQIE